MNYFKGTSGTSGCVVECRICIREVAGSNLSLGYFVPRSTQPSIPSGSINEYQLRLGRQRQVWLIPIADERVGVQEKLWNPLRTRAIRERFCGGDSLRRGAISSVSVCTLDQPATRGRRRPRTFGWSTYRSLWPRYCFSRQTPPPSQDLSTNTLPVTTSVASSEYDIVHFRPAQRSAPWYQHNSDKAASRRTCPNRSTARWWTVSATRTLVALFYPVA